MIRNSLKRCTLAGVELLASILKFVRHNRLFITCFKLHLLVDSCAGNRASTSEFLRRYRKERAFFLDFFGSFLEMTSYPLA